MSEPISSTSDNDRSAIVLLDGNAPADSSKTSRRTGASQVVLLGVLVLVELLQWLFVYQIARRPIPSLVQLQDGTSIQVEAIAPNERTPAAIRSYVYTALTALFTATGTVQDGSGKRIEDRQFQLGDRPVATSAWAASHALAGDFPRSSMLQRIANITPPEVFDTDAQTEVHLEIRNLSDPIPVGDGQWQVDVVATRVVTQQGIETDRLPFNKSVFVRAIEPYRAPEASTPVTLAMQGYRSGGMEIYAIDGLRVTPIVESEEEP
ncbi:MAG: hypothetical protein AAFX40_13340 [Cyanobacteria bacterium J06639_1]